MNMFERSTRVAGVAVLTTVLLTATACLNGGGGAQPPSDGQGEVGGNIQIAW